MYQVFQTQFPTYEKNAVTRKIHSASLIRQLREKKTRLLM